MPTVMADYVTERHLFGRLLEQNPEFRILLIQGQSGTGKTTLLCACRETLEHHDEEVAVVPIEFRGAAINLVEIFYRTGRMLGWSHFPNFLALVERFQGLRTVDIKHTPLIGINNKIEVAIGSDKLKDEEQRLALLTDTWFDDLERFPHRLLFMFDSYEKATTMVRRWLDGPFLIRASDLPHVRVLVAGQKVPNWNNIEWGKLVRKRHLTGVREVDQWMHVFEALERMVDFASPHDFLATLCYHCKGQPDVIRQAIEGLPSRRPEA